MSVELTEARDLAHVGLGHLRRDRFSLLPVHPLPPIQDRFIGRFASGVRPHTVRVGRSLGPKRANPHGARANVGRRRFVASLVATSVFEGVPRRRGCSQLLPTAPPESPLLVGLVVELLGRAAKHPLSARPGDPPSGRGIPRAARNRDRAGQRAIRADRGTPRSARARRGALRREMQPPTAAGERLRQTREPLSTRFCHYVTAPTLTCGNESDSASDSRSSCHSTASDQAKRQ